MIIPYLTVTFGADPEFFFKQKGKVIGAEKVLPKAGITQQGPGNDQMKAIIIDGVQAEFNPLPNYCRQSFSHNLRTCFLLLQETIKNKKVEVDFGASVQIDETELASLEKENQTFGCSPSDNTYRKTAIQVKDPTKYLHRSAGGHIHLGHSAVKKNPALTVKVLDVLLGNTCVLLDRDPGNIERRKNYGRAGEYRLPPHGLEYRTLSNFWLRSYPMMSFVLAVARFAVSVGDNPEATKKLLALVDMEKIERAINENDFVLAQENFNAIKPFLVAAQTHDNGTATPFYGSRLAAFERLVALGIETAFPEDPMTHWTHHDYHINGGWEIFADQKI